MPFIDESGNAVQLSPQDQAAYWQSQGGQPGALVDESGKPVDPFSLPASDIADLVKQTPDKFDLVSQFAARPDLQKDPATVAKVADAFHQLREQPIDWKDVAKHAPQNVWNVISGLARYGVKVTSGTLKQLNSLGIAAAPQEGSEEAAAEAQKESRQELGEAAASAEQGMTGLVSGAVSAAKALGRGIGIAKPLKDYDQSDKVSALFDALAKTQQSQQIASGQGPLAQAVTGGAVPVRPEEVAKLTSPFDWEALGAGTKAAGAVLPSAAPLLAKAGDVATTVGGKAVTAAAQGAELATKGAKTVLPGASGVGGAIVGGHLAGGVPIVGNIFGAVEGFERGAKFAKHLTPVIEKLGDAADFGKQISGDAPLTSAYAQLARSALQSAPTAAAELGKGVAFDLSQVAGADTPQERESAVGLGTAFGLLGAANASGRHVISGQLIAPRDYAVGRPIKSSGSFPDLDSLHDAAFANLNDGQKARINATRLFLSKAAPGTDVFVTGDNADATSAALQASGMSKSQADFYADQQGFSTRLNGRKIIGVQEPGSAPHEAFHGIEDVIGAAKMRELDDAVKQQYAGNWDDFGRYYTSRLTGQDTGPDWRTPLLDASGWGNVEAVEKLYRESALKYSQEAQANGQPPPTEEQVKEAVKAQGPIDWRSVLTPEEQREASDRYIAREKLAENFDAAFKHSGPTLEPGQQMPEKVARTLGQMMQFFGANPIQGQRSEALGVPLSPSIISKVGEAARIALPDISAAPILGGKERIEPTAPVSGPTPPTTADTARRLAQEQPDVPLPGQNQSQREIAGAAAEAFANDSALHLQYSSAPDEPAASLGLNLSRKDRRGMIEAFRQMPDSVRQLFGKLFFPKKFKQTKNQGLQIQGWSPEVFAANAHRWSKFIGELAQKSPEAAQSLAHYEIGPQGLTEKGWQDLYGDLQNFVANQRAGKTGAGEGLVVPRKVTEAGYFAPPTIGKAGEALPQGKADLINMLFGFRLPGTEGKATRAGGAAGVRLPQNIAGRLISEATQPGRVSPPVEPRGAFGGAAAERQGVAGEPVTEVNPYRKALEQAAKENGVATPSMIESWQNLNLNRIKEAELAPEQPKFGANPLTLQAGFLPRKEVAIEGPDGKKYRATFDGYQDMSILGRGMVPQFTALEDLPGGPIKGSTTYKPSLEKAGYKVPTDIPAPGAQAASAQMQPKTFVVRHGSTEMNSDNPDKDLIRGHINVPLDAKGKKEAQETARQIASQGGVQHIITSDLDRTVDTAKAIQDANPGATITEDSGLRPWKFGPTIEGKPTSEMLPKIRELTNNPDQRPPGGETFNEFKDRFLESFHRAQDTTPDVNSAIVTHYRGTKLLDAWRKTGVDNDTIDKAVFEKYDKNLKPGNVDVIDKTGAELKNTAQEQTAAPAAESRANVTAQSQFSPTQRRSRDDYKLPEGGPGLFQKAWIMPDGKPVQLGDQMHHDWLNENPAIKKQYGIKGSDEDNRVEALQKGFARINYEKNTGTLTVEARAQDWPKLRDSVKQFASVNLPKIDNMDVSLLDPKAKKTVAADGVQLHSYPTVEEKMEQLPFIGTGGGVTELSPQASASRAQFMPETRWYGKEREGEREVEWNFLDQSLLNPDHRTPFVVDQQKKGALPNVTLEELQKEGYKTVSFAGTPTFHDFSTRAVFYKNDRGDFPLTPEGVRQASDAASKEEDQVMKIAYPGEESQFLPSTEPRALRSAAVRDPETGQIFEAPFHAMAVQHALGLPGYKNVTPEALASFEHGFTTNEGEFLDRAQSAARAAEMNQLQQGVGPAQLERKGGIGIEHLKNEVLTQMNENRKNAIPQLMQASPKETIAAFKDEKTLPVALHNARYAIITANRESVGPATNPTNQLANENLEKALIADGYNPQPVSGEYKGVNQGQSFLVPDMAPEDAIRYAKNYEQESVLTPHGLLYQNGEINPAVPSDTVVGESAKQREGWSQVEGGPAFSMGLDFEKRVPLEQAIRSGAQSASTGINITPTEKAFDWHGKLTTAGIDDKEDPFSALGAFAGDKMVGSIIYQVIPGDMLWVEHAYVKPQYRRQGIAESLIQEARKNNPNLPIEGRFRSEEMEKLADKLNAAPAQQISIKPRVLK